jgi:5-methylcytosine-specific restriction protein A
MSRSVPEWIGTTDDTPVPDRVRVRVFQRFKGICQECGVKIIAKRWVCDHRKALINGGENREKNLGPIHEACDPKKTSADVAEKSKVYEMTKRHLGIRKPKGRPMPGTKASGIKMKFGGGWEYRQ